MGKITGPETVVEHAGGVGINSRYHVERDGKTVAGICRYDTNSFVLVSAYYDGYRESRLAVYRGPGSLAEARDQAQEREHTNPR